VADIITDRRGAAAIAALCGCLAVSPYLVAPNGAIGSLILVYLAQLPLFAVGLWRGAEASALAGLAASVILALAGNFIIAAAFAGLNGVPVFLMVRQALLSRSGADGVVEWYPPGCLTAWLTGLGLAVIVGALFLFGGPDEMRAELRELLALAPDGDTAVAEEVIGVLAFILPGVIAASWMVMTATNGMLAQGLLARFEVSRRPSPDLTALTLPVWIPMLLALAAAANLFGGTPRFIGVNVMIVLIVPFCLAGLALIHTVARRLRHPMIPLVTFYVISGLFGWPLVLAAVLGVIDSSLGLRRRFAQP
jgi:hypothetical protein